MSKDIIDRARAQFRARRELKGPILVPEWGLDGQPLEIYYRTLNVKERDQVYAKLNENPFEANILAIVLNSYDGDGKRLFSMAERVALREDADPDVILRIAAEMLAAEDVSGADMGN